MRTVVTIEILVAIVVDVGEGGGDRDPARQTDAGLGGDVAEFPVSQVLPQLAAAHLAGEIEVHEPVAVHVRRGDAVAMVVVGRLVGPAGVFHDLVDEGDAALFNAIGEFEVDGDLELAGGGALRLLARGQGLRPDVDGRHVDHRAVGAGSGRSLRRGSVFMRLPERARRSEGEQSNEDQKK